MNKIDLTDMKIKWKRKNKILFFKGKCLFTGLIGGYQKAISSGPRVVGIEICRRNRHHIRK